MLAKFVRLFDQLKKKKRKENNAKCESEERTFLKNARNLMRGVGDLNKKKEKEKENKANARERPMRENSQCERNIFSYVSLGGCVLSESYFMCRPTGDVVVVSAAYGIGVSNRTFERDLATISLAKFLPYCSANWLYNKNKAKKRSSLF